MSDMAIWVVFYKEQSGRGVPKYGNMSDMAIWVVFYKEQSGGGFQNMAIWQYDNMWVVFYKELLQVGWSRYERMSHQAYCHMSRTI